LIAIFSFAGLAADWRKQPFTEWAPAGVLRILTDSPWTRPKTVALQWRERERRPITYKDIPGADHGKANASLGPLGGIHPPKTKNKLEDRADILLRWVSALPVRHAVAMYKHREQGEKGSLNSLIPPPEKDYVLEVYGLPLELAHAGLETIQNIATSGASLRLRNGRSIKASHSQASVQSDSLAIRIHFPSETPIALDDQELEVAVELQVTSIRERFRLAPMTYMGRLEI
jgi:hypothetical protein